jgi:hypothetical protein
MWMWSDPARARTCRHTSDQIRTGRRSGRLGMTRPRQYPGWKTRYAASRSAAHAQDDTRSRAVPPLRVAPVANQARVIPGQHTGRPLRSEIEGQHGDRCLRGTGPTHQRPDPGGPDPVRGRWRYGPYGVVARGPCGSMTAGGGVPAGPGIPRGSPTRWRGGKGRSCMAFCLTVAFRVGRIGSRVRYEIVPECRGDRT